MEFKLNERQSYEILKHLGNYRSIIDKVNEEAYDILMRYYTQYSSVPKNYWFKPMSQDKFLSKMCKGTGSIGVYVEHGWQKTVYSYNGAKIDIDYLRKYGISVEPIAHTVIDAALEAPYINSKTVRAVDEMYSMLMEYASPPFVVDDKLISMFKQVKESNEKRILVLSGIGINYEL